MSTMIPVIWGGTTAFTFTVFIDNEASEDITVVANTNGVTATGGGAMQNQAQVTQQGLFNRVGGGMGWFGGD